MLFIKIFGVREQQMDPNLTVNLRKEINKATKIPKKLIQIFCPSDGIPTDMILVEIISVSYDPVDRRVNKCIQEVVLSQIQNSGISSDICGGKLMDKDIFILPVEYRPPKDALLHEENHD